jgi:hypothetical protein
MLRYATFVTSSFTKVNSGVTKLAGLPKQALPEEFLEVPITNKNLTNEHGRTNQKIY